MNPQLPDTVRQAWGEAAARDFTTWLEIAMTKHAVEQDNWSLAQARFDSMETRIDRVVAAFNERFDRQAAEMNERFDRQAAEMNERFDRQAAEMNARFDRQAAEMNERFDRQAAEMNARFAEVNARFERQASEFNIRFDQLQRQMLSQTRWTVGTLALFGTIIAILVGIGQLRLFLP